MTSLDSLGGAEIFAGLPKEDADRVAVLAQRRSFKLDAVVFKLGDPTDFLYVIREGRVDLTFPLLVMGESREVRFESLGPGRTLAWSALVPPHRLTMGARAATDVELYVLPRDAMLQFFRDEPRIAVAVMANLAAVVGGRLQATQALWIREVQRNVSATYR